MLMCSDVFMDAVNRKTSMGLMVRWFSGDVNW